MVIMCVFDARTGGLGALVPSSGSGEEQDYCWISVTIFSYIENLLVKFKS